MHNTCCVACTFILFIKSNQFLVHPCKDGIKQKEIVSLNPEHLRPLHLISVLFCKIRMNLLKMLISTFFRPHQITNISLFTLSDAVLEVLGDFVGVVVLGVGQERLLGLEIALACLLQLGHREVRQALLEVIRGDDTLVQEVRRRT